MDSTNSTSPDGTNRGQAGQARQRQDFRVILKHYRLAAGWTQEQLAERAGVCIRSISNLERGSRHVPRGDTIRMIASALELPAEDIKAFMEAARVHEDGELLTSPTYAPGLSLVSMPRSSLAPTAALPDSAREVTAIYEFLRRVGGLLREIG